MSIFHGVPPGHVYGGAWFYHDATGNEIGAMVRYDSTSEPTDKTFVAFKCERGEWAKSGMAKPRPLYNLPGIMAAASTTTVLVVEGEKTADAAAKLFPDMVATTSPHGAQGAAGTDWAPLKGRDIVIWPDADEPGGKYAKAVLKQVGEARVVDIGSLGLPEGFDLADEIPAGVDIRAAVASAKPGRPKGKDALKASIAGAVAPAEPPPPTPVEPIDGAELLDGVLAYYQRFVVYPSEHAAVAHTLWTIHTHLMPCWETTPRLAFMSAEKRSGKSRAMEVTALLVHNALASSGASAQAVVRAIDAEACTVLHDEIDAVYGTKQRQEGAGDLTAVYNAGYRYGASVIRCVGPQHQPARFNAYAPLAVAGLRDLPDTLADRAILIRMRRRAPDEAVDAFRYRLHSREAEAIRQKIADWSAQHEEQLKEALPALPAGVDDRAADCWEPLIAIADVAGGQWPRLTRAAAQHFVKAGADETASSGVELLEHIKEAFGDQDRLWTDELLRRLHDRPESPWKDLRGKPLDDRGLAKRLKGFGVGPHTVREGGKTARGYYAADFNDPWRRYLPSDTPKAPSSHPERHKQHSQHIIDNKNNNVSDVSDVLARVPEEGTSPRLNGNGRASAGGDCRPSGDALLEERVAWLIKDGYTREEAVRLATFDDPVEEPAADRVDFEERVAVYEDMGHTREEAERIVSAAFLAGTQHETDLTIPAQFDRTSTKDPNQNG